MMTLAGIDESIGPYHCKHAALTKAWLDGAKKDQIEEAAGWAPGSRMFDKHYKVLSSSENVRRLIVGVEGKGRKRRNKGGKKGRGRVVVESS
jgi:hypothetical protein